MRLLQVTLFSFLLLGLASCSKEHSYDIKIVNKTDYNFDSVVVDEKEFTIPSKSSSPTFELKWRKPKFPMAEPFMDIRVASCSDSSGVYDITTSVGLIGMYDLIEESTNTVIIELHEGSPCCAFSFSLE